MSKYQEVMEHVKVDDEMKNRILQNLEKEMENAPSAPETTEDTGDKVRPFRSRFGQGFKRYAAVAAMLGVLIVGTSAVIRMTGGISNTSTSPMYDSAPAAEVAWTESETAEEAAMDAEITEEAAMETSIAEEAVMEAETADEAAMETATAEEAVVESETTGEATLNAPDKEALMGTGKISSSSKTEGTETDSIAPPSYSQGNDAKAPASAEIIDAEDQSSAESIDAEDQSSAETIDPENQYSAETIEPASPADNTAQADNIAPADKTFPVLLITILVLLLLAAAAVAAWILIKRRKK